MKKMKKKILVALACAGCFAIPSCLSIDQAGLLDLGGDLLCEVVAGGLPFSGHLDYCSVIDIDLPLPDDMEEE